MATLYENPPLTEAICDIIFGGDVVPQLTLPGLFYAKVRDRLPISEEVTEYEVLEGPDGKPRVEPHTPLVRFLDKDRSRVAQVGSNRLVCNILPPYPGWNEFARLFEEFFTYYSELAPTEGVFRLALRYINRIPVPYDMETPFRLRRYLNAYPTFPKTENNRIQAYHQRVMTVTPYGTLTVITDNAPPKDGVMVISVDLEMVTGPGRSIASPGEPALAWELSGIRAWLDSAHATIEDMFLACITPEAEKLFGRKLSEGSTAGDSVGSGQPEHIEGKGAAV